MQSEIARVLDVVGLTGHEKKKVGEFSKGMQQRLSVSSALLSDAELFVLDEPMSGMDPLGRALFREIFRKLSSQGKSVFFSTHVLDDVQSVCQRVVALSKGSLVYSGDIPTLMARGYTGTEITVQSLNEETRNALKQKECSIADGADGTVLISVPAEGSVADCQVLLYEHDTVPISVVPRNQSLEDILYPGGEEVRR
jgi:ABC-2 type transport system ATP-binding protein